MLSTVSEYICFIVAYLFSMVIGGLVSMNLCYSVDKDQENLKGDLFLFGFILFPFLSLIFFYILFILVCMVKMFRRNDKL